MLEQLRRAEPEVLKGWSCPDVRILEIGGGSGFQAGVVASRGYESVSNDQPERPFPPPYMFPVADYDGVHITAPDANCDVQQVVGNELCYTGCALFPNISVERRRELSRLPGSARRVYVMNKLDS